MTSLIDLQELTLKDIEHLMAAWGQPAFRGRQLLKWLYKGVSDFREMTDIAKGFREELSRRAYVGRLRVAREQEAADGCRKFLFDLGDGCQVESVLIPEEGHLTLCLSTQVGCAQGCRFCLTARGGLVRQLTAGEIVGQVLAVRRWLTKQSQAPQAVSLPLTNLVFMGMGEPLANFSPLVKAITMITAAWGLNFSPRRLTVSTVGLAPLIPRLGRQAPANLTVSLNAPDDRTRDRLMPVNRRYPLAELLAACRSFPLPRHRRITFAYVLLKDVNDAPDQARQLARLLKGFRAKINLIPFNPHPDLPFAPPAPERLLEFQEILRAACYPALIREGRGRDIGAACGHLVGGRTPGIRP